MTTGTEIKCATHEDMLEFVHYIRDRGGECVCVDWELQIIRVIRGTKNDEKTELFNIDGVLGAVNIDNNTGKRNHI